MSGVDECSCSMNKHIANEVKYYRHSVQVLHSTSGLGHIPLHIIEFIMVTVLGRKLNNSLKGYLFN